MSEAMATMAGIKRQAILEDPYEPAQTVIDYKQSQERRHKRVQSLVSSWPIGAGILLALCAPMLSDILSAFKPWGMWLVFPFVELVARPELHMGPQFAQSAPQVMLFLQFPLEGLMAKKFLKGRVAPRAVLGQVMIYHILGAVQLFLVWRALGGGPVN